MARTLSEGHKAAMAEGRKRAEEDRKVLNATFWEDFCAWSKENAKLWMAWEENCGKVCEEPCEYCVAYRASNAAIPEMKGESDDCR